MALQNRRYTFPIFSNDDRICTSFFFTFLLYILTHIPGFRFQISA
jgi:hypothetical protein